MGGVVLALLVLGAAAKKPAPAPPAPFSDEALAAWTAEIVPAVERAAGRPFLTPPVVKLATPEAFGRMAREEIELITSAVMEDVPPELKEELSEGQDEVPMGLLGKYGIFTKELYLCRQPIEAAAAGTDVVALAKIILAHELTHALHDQHGDLASLVRRVPDRDALWAAQGTWEGLATWVEERVANELGLQEAYRFATALQGWSPSGLEQRQAYPVWAVYGRGRDAMAWHFEHGGYDEVWAVAAAPPLSSRALFRPAAWAEPRTPPPLDYAGVLRGTEQKLTEAPWVVAISLLGEFDLRGEAVMGGNEAAVDEVLAHLRQSWHLDAVRDDRHGEIRVLEFDDPAWPKRYLEVLRAQETTVAADLAAAIGREIEVRYEPFVQVPADDATLRISRVAGAGGVWSEKHAAWVVRGSTLVVVEAERFRPGLRTGWTVEEVFGRLEAARSP